MAENYSPMWVSNFCPSIYVHSVSPINRWHLPSSPSNLLSLRLLWPIKRRERNIMSIQSKLLRTPGSFYMLKSSHCAVRKPKQLLWNIIQTSGWQSSLELPVNSQYQLASYRSAPSWKYILQPQLKHPSWRHMEQSWALPNPIQTATSLLF